MDAINPRLVDRHFRVVLPKEVVDFLGLERGSHVAFTVSDGEVRMQRVRLTLEG
ncbi:MAG: AbrB/MazE/SpoVT family DNA-binding domain-containing protein [Halobacteriales archaeon]|nr:AbrB/MazE/SpoVT family DNA-binding domain-containing protein [Halobacteriales archaeon]